jgi:hypothetical protein
MDLVLSTIRKLVDDIVYEIDTQQILVKEGEVNTGANPSAEEQEEALESGAKPVNNVVHSHRLVSTSFDKKSYLSHLKVWAFFMLGYVTRAKARSIFLMSLRDI